MENLFEKFIPDFRATGAPWGWDHPIVSAFRYCKTHICRGPNICRHILFAYFIPFPFNHTMREILTFTFYELGKRGPKIEIHLLFPLSPSSLQSRCPLGPGGPISLDYISLFLGP